MPESPQLLQPCGVVAFYLASMCHGGIGEPGFGPGVFILVEAEHRHELRVLLETLIHERVEERVELCGGATCGRRGRKCCPTKCRGDGGTHHRASGHGQELATIDHRRSLFWRGHVIEPGLWPPCTGSRESLRIPARKFIKGLRGCDHPERQCPGKLETFRGPPHGRYGVRQDRPRRNTL